MEYKAKLTNQTNSPPKKLKEEMKMKKRAASFSQESAIFTSPTDLKKLRDKIRNEGIPENRVISKDTIDKSKVISIKGKIFLNQNEVYINASGLIDKQKRKTKTNRGDGVVYFWTNSQNVDTKAKKDVVLDANFSLFESRFFFGIFFALDIMEYKIKFNLFDNDKIEDLFNSVQIMLPYGYPYPFSKKTFLSLSNSKFQISSVVNNIIEVTNLKSNQKFIFNPLAITQVTIGRDKYCTICIDDDKNLSPIQTTLNYDSKKKSWSIRDGSDKKESKTGTWLIGFDSYIVRNSMKIKINESILDITIN